MDNRNRIGGAVPRTEKTLEVALDLEIYANEIYQKYDINLKGSGQDLTIEYNPHFIGKFMKKSEINPNIIQIGPYALMSESELANTIAYELNHARDFIKGGATLESPACASGNALLITLMEVYKCG